MAKKGMTIAENQRSRNWCMLLYLDDPTHIMAYEMLGKGYQYVSILHDSCIDDDGNPKKPHYHIVIRFQDARWKTAIAEEFGIQSNYLEVCRSLKSAYCYLVHDGIANAHQYPHTCLNGPLYREACKALEKEKDQNEKMLSIFKLIDESGFLNERQLLEKACKAGLVGDVLRLGGLMSRLIEIHNCDISEGLPF